MKKWFAKRCPRVTESVKRNIESITHLEQEILRQRSPVACASERITRCAGSLSFAVAHVVWFSAWILLNTLHVRGLRHFDPFPFNFLALCVALEAVLLTTCVLMSQNLQSRRADQWAHVDLQISLLAEQELTKMLQLLQGICQHLKIETAAHDKELKEMVETTHVVALMQELEKAREADEAAGQAA